MQHEIEQAIPVSIMRYIIMFSALFIGLCALLFLVLVTFDIEETLELA